MFDLGFEARMKITETPRMTVVVDEIRRKSETKRTRSTIYYITKDREEKV